MRMQPIHIQQVAGVHTCGVFLDPRNPSGPGRVIRLLSHVASSHALPLTMTGTREVFVFGEFELDVEAGELRRKSRRIKLQPQPFKLVLLLVRKGGALVTRDEIRAELWPDGTFVDFDQAVNFSIKQIRDALGDDAEHPLYIVTVPRRGYRFIAPISTPGQQPPRHSFFPMSATGIRLEKALWTNIAELRLAQSRRQRYLWLTISILAVLLAVAAVLLFVR